MSALLFWFLCFLLENISSSSSLVEYSVSDDVDEWENNGEEDESGDSELCWFPELDEDDEDDDDDDEEDDEEDEEEEEEGE